MTDPATSDAPAGPRRARRRHPALASRIAVTGASAATMFGIVAALGATAGSQDTTETAPASTLAVDPVTPSTAPVVDATTTVPTTTVPATTVPATEPVPVTELSNEPIQLTAEPDVRVVQTPSAPAAQAPAPAPEASTNGSR